MAHKNRCVIVTGAGGIGCGRSISVRFASSGASVVVSDIDDAGGHETVHVIERNGGRAAFLRADVRKEKENVASISALWHGRKTPGGFPGYDIAKAGMIRMTTRLASLAETDNIRVNCLAPGWIATEGVRPHWERMTPAERAARGVPSRLLTTDQVSEAVIRLAEDRSLAGRVLVWWSEDTPRLIEWGDRGYHRFAEF